MCKKFFEINMTFTFKGFIAIVLILLFTQQSLAAYAPMICNDMENSSIASAKNVSHHTSTMTMHEHDSVAKNKNTSHEACDICNSGDCICDEMGGCLNLSSLHPIYSLEQNNMLFVDSSKRFLPINESSDSRVNLNLFRPPINI